MPSSPPATRNSTSGPNASSSRRSPPSRSGVAAAARVPRSGPAAAAGRHGHEGQRVSRSRSTNSRSRRNGLSSAGIAPVMRSARMRLAAGLAHHAVAAVSGVHEEAFDLGLADQRAVIGRHRVLAGLQEPRGRAAVPHVAPEGRDPSGAERARRVEHGEREPVIERDLVGRRARFGRPGRCTGRPLRAGMDASAFPCRRRSSSGRPAARRPGRGTSACAAVRSRPAASIRASRATSPDSGPHAMTAALHATGPREVSTPTSRPASTENPVTRVSTATGAPLAAASPSVSSFGSRNPSPARNRAWITSGAT